MSPVTSSTGMGRRRSGFRIPTLGLPEQGARVRHRWPNLRCVISGPVLSCKGPVQPLPIGQSYQVRLAYRVNKWPRAYVDRPGLRRRDREPDLPIPHTYKSKTPGQERPCLFYPDRTVWRPDMGLATTIIPWLYEWLAHYELWHATGEWRGGGVDHVPGTKK